MPYQSSEKILRQRKYLSEENIFYSVKFFVFSLYFVLPFYSVMILFNFREKRRTLSLRWRETRMSSVKRRPPIKYSTKKKI